MLRLALAPSCLIATSPAPSHAQYEKYDHPKEANAYYGCLLASEAIYETATCEPAQTVVDATFAKCTRQLEALRNTMKSDTNAELVDGALNALIREWRTDELPRVLDSRIHDGRCPGFSN